MVCVAIGKPRNVSYFICKMLITMLFFFSGSLSNPEETKYVNYRMAHGYSITMSSEDFVLRIC